jgi:hypothetical protein
MARNYFFFIFLLISILASYAKTNNDSILKVLDKEIQNKQIYEQFIENEIDSVKNILSTTLTKEQLFDVYLDLFFKYKKYNIAEAYDVTMRRCKLAEEMNNPDFITVASLNHAEVLGLAGRYKEAFDILDAIDVSQLDYNLKGYVFHIYHSIYLRLYEITLISHLKQTYKGKIDVYKDSLLQHNEVGSIPYNVLYSGKLVDQQKYDEALGILNEIYVFNTKNNYISGAIPYLIAEIYLQKGDVSNAVYYLAVSATNDIKNSVKSYKSLQRLSILLYEQGDVDRAYRYIQCAIEDAISSGSSFRLIEVSNIIPIINTAYSNNERIKKEKLKTLLFVVVALLLITLVSLLFIYVQKRMISKTKNELQLLNQHLVELNAKLDKSNEELQESNRVKEEYLGAVFTICSGYIDKIQLYTNSIQKSINENRIDKINKIIATMQEHDELKFFYENFDTIFLKLYPSFIHDINRFLKEDEQIVQKSPNQLTPETRVLALHRLGIFDTTKIAHLLHYSAQTVYNYKLKIHNKLTVSKEEFYLGIQNLM